MEREDVRGKGRGALLGPEESGRVSLGARTVFSGSRSHRRVLVCGWLGPALTILAVGASDGCVVSLEGVSVC